MNPDQYPNINQNPYFPLKNSPQIPIQIPKDQKKQSDHDYHQNQTQNHLLYTDSFSNPIQHNQQDYRQIQPNFDQNSQNPIRQPPHDIRMIPNQINPIQPNQPQHRPRNQVIIYNQMGTTTANLRNYQQNKKIHVIVDGANDKDSIIYGQSVPCQKCGLVANGPLNLTNGRTICAWATCLFLTTGIFCFIPCVMDSCKDTDIGCPRCGHTKAVVKSKLCC